MLPQEHEESDDVTPGQQPPKQNDKAGLLSKALRAPLGTRTLSLHNLLDQAPILEGQQVCMYFAYQHARITMYTTMGQTSECPHHGHFL